MHRREFRFDETWLCPGPADVVGEVLTDLAEFPAWWSQVVDVAKIDDETARVVCRSVLPYTLDLVLTSVRRDPPLEVRVAGDLVGWVRIGLAEHAGGTTVRYRQQVVVPGWRGYAAMPLRRLLRWNHARMMVGLRDGLAGRVRAYTDRTSGPPGSS
jgi:hypothetical protein